MRLNIFLGLTFGLFIVLMVGSATASDEGDSVEVYTIAGWGDSGYPSPYGHYPRGPGYICMSLIFDTLVWKDDSGYVPALAEKWYVGGDDTYVFELRKNVTWNDGTKFSADDVVFTIDYTKDHPYIWASTEMVDSVEKVNDYRVKMHLSEPYAPFIDEVGNTLPILPKHVWENVDDPSNFVEDDALVGTGPYLLMDYDNVQGTYRYKAYEDYYLGTPRVKEIRLVNVASETAPAALMQGDVDATSITQEMVELLEDDFVILSSEANGLQYKLMVNHQKEPMSSKEFRQALAYAIDREKLVDIAGRGYGQVGNQGQVPPYSSWYNPDVKAYEYDPEKAKLFLAEAEYAGQEVELLIDGSSVLDERFGELISKDLENVRINVNLRSMDSKTIDSKVGEWDFDLALNSHGGALGDPNFLAKVNNGWQFNSDRYSDNQDLIDLLEEQVKEMDEDGRRDLVDHIQVIYAEDVPVIVLYYPEWFWAHDGEVEIYYTINGVANGIPIPINKMAFL